MKKILLITLLTVLTLASTVFAEGGDITGTSSVTTEPVKGETVASEGHIYHFPEIEPEASIHGGYRFVHTGGSSRAEEFEYLHNSISFGGRLRLFPLPHRFHLDAEIKNSKDYFGDLSYGYEDIIMFRGINRTLFHNLENIRLIDLNTATASPGVDVRDRDKEYGRKTGISNVFLRFKTHDFPFHIYIDGTLIKKDGLMQQRRMGGAGYFNNIVRASQSRDVNWKTKNIIIGANSHIGPIEVDISHGEKRFDVGTDSYLVDHYGPAGFDFGPPSTRGSVRKEGDYPHNFIPELKGSSNTLKLHTSYTGSLVATATFTKIKKENRDSDAKADYFIGAGEAIWMPLTKLTFFLKYRHRETDIDNPDTVKLFDSCSSSNNINNNYKCAIKPSVSSVTDDVSGSVRYRPISGLTIWGVFSRENIHRKDADEWKLPQSTQKSTASLSADINIIKNIKLKTRYTHKNINNPAKNSEPDHSDEGKISISWIPIPAINTLVSYIVESEKRRDLHFLNGEGEPVPGTENRHVNRDRLLGSVTFLILKDLSLTTSYSYIHNKIKQDIVFNDTTGIAHVNSSVPYKDIANSYALDINYLPKNSISLNAGVSHTLSRGTFYPSDQNLLQPISIASFSEMKTKETLYSASGEYRFKGGFALRLQYRYSDFDDVLDNPFDDVQDGEAHIIMLTASKNW